MNSNACVPSTVLRSATAKRTAALIGSLLILACQGTRATEPTHQTESAHQSVPIESVDATTRATWLLDGQVLDSDTRKPIKEFTVTPGSLGTDDNGKSTVRWRDNLKREMQDGRLLWPRTSGFSVMRFKISADGYRPVITHRVWRGGPHSRLSIRLHAVESSPSSTPESNRSTESAR